MTDDDIPEMDLTPRGQKRWRISLTWAVPLIAVAVAGGIAWHSIDQRGPLISIEFDDASGITAGQTQLKYREMTVGTVESLGFNSDLTKVVVKVRLDKDIARFVDDDAKFWVVQPSVGPRGITGLNTVLSGVYIEGSWDGTPDKEKYSFVGEKNPPLVQAGQKGTVVTLHSDAGGRVADGAPVVYRGVDVGQIDEPKLSDDGKYVSAHAFIRAPYDKLLTTNTRFWSASGFSVKIGPGGVSLDVANLASLVEGGITFGQPIEGGEALPDNATFDVYKDEDAARKAFSVAATMPKNAITLSSVFDTPMAGLTEGAPVELAGVQVGEVTNLNAFIARDDATRSVRLRVDFSVDPAKIGLDASADHDQVLAYLKDAVGKGLRAELVNQNIFTTSLKLVLTDADNPEPASFDETAQPYPLLPTLPVNVKNPADTAQGMVDRIMALPFDKLMDSAISVLDSFNGVLQSDDIKQAPKAAVDLLNQTRDLVAAIDPKPLLDNINGTIADVRKVVDALGSDQNTAAVSGALARLGQLQDTLQTTAEKLPGLIDSAQAVTDKAKALNLDPLLDAATGTAQSLQTLAQSPDVQALPSDLRGLLGSARAFVDAPETKALPGALNDAIATLQGTANDLRGVIANVGSDANTKAISDAIQRVDSLAGALQATAQKLPPLIDQAQAVADKAQALDLEPLVQAATGTAQSLETIAASPDTQAIPGAVRGLIGSAQSVVGAPETQALPKNLATAMGTLQSMLDKLQQAHAIDTVTDALNRLDTITAQVQDTTNGLPAIRQQIEDLVAKANGLPLEDLVNSATHLVNTTDTLLGSDSTAKVPQALTDALTQVSQTLDALRQGGTVDNVNAALASAQQAAASISVAAQSLPELSQRLNALVSQADALMQTYGARSQFSSQTVQALNDVRQAAQAVTQLARSIERNPQQLLLGR